MELEWKKFPGFTKLGILDEIQKMITKSKCEPESLFRDRTVSWVRIVNGINKYVTETSEEIHIASIENRVQGNLSRRLNHDQSRL